MKPPEGQGPRVTELPPGMAQGLACSGAPWISVEGLSQCRVRVRLSPPCGAGYGRGGRRPRTDDEPLLAGLEMVHVNARCVAGTW